MGNYEIKKARAIALTVEGYTQKAIAEALTIDTRTIRRWAKEPDFVAALQEERESALVIAKAHAASMYLADIEEGRASNQFLVKIRENSDLEVRTRMRAAQLLMNQALKSTALMIKEEQANRTKADTDSSRSTGRPGSTSRELTSSLAAFTSFSHASNCLASFVEKRLNGVSTTSTRVAAGFFSITVAVTGIAIVFSPT